MSLLKTAQAHQVQKFNRNATRNRAQEEVEELAIAWITGAVSFAQAAAALGSSGSAVYGLLGVALRRCALKGRIKISVCK